MIVPWVVGTIAFMAMEAVGTVYSNVLRDHVNHVSILFLTLDVVFLHEGKCVHFA